MLKRIRRMKMPLAAKCQLLFGAALLAIIVSALWVPWRRTEQLTQQLDERAARTLADHVMREHVALIEAGASGDALFNRKPDANVEPPRLIGLRMDPSTMTRFQNRALQRFVGDPESDWYAQSYERKDGAFGYRFAMALYARADCLKCHTAEADAGSGGPTTPTTRPAGLLGLVTVDIPSQVETNQLLLNRVAFLAAGLLAGALAVATFYLITDRLILKPVRVLQETAEKVSQGDLNIRSNIPSGDEFQQLSETFNTMLGNLEQSAEQLRTINRGLDLKLGQLAETNVALYESNRLKSEFLANVSHELRTPLNSILGFAELLKSAVAQLADGKSVRYAQNILQSGQSLLALINDLLDLAKIEAGKMEVRVVPLSILDLFEGLGNLLKPLLEVRGLILVDTVAADVPILQTDRDKLQQVLYNFLSNAIKFSPQGSHIYLSAEKEGDAFVKISVRDEGPGIDPSKHLIIFEKFRQADGSVTRQYGGTGLGLAISRELTALLQGTIGVQSALGEGATFWVRLPISIAPPATEERTATTANA